MKKNRDCRTFTVAGIVTGCREGMTKKSTPYGILTLQDYTGSYEFALFGNDYTAYRNFLKENLFIAIIVKTQERGSDWKYPSKNTDNTPKEIEAKILKMELLENVAEKLVKKLTISLQLGRINAELTQRLLEILSDNNGQTELFLEVYDPETSSNINLRSKKLHVNPTNKLITELESIEREGLIKFWINNNKIVKNEEL